MEELGSIFVILISQLTFMTLRTDKVNALLQREISEAIHEEVELPEGILVTVTRVKVSKDLRYACAWLSILPFKQSESVLTILKQNIRQVQASLNKDLFMHNVPKVGFKIDESEERAGEVEQLVSGLHAKEE